MMRSKCGLFYLPRVLCFGTTRDSWAPNWSSLHPNIYTEHAHNLTLCISVFSLLLKPHSDRFIPYKWDCTCTELPFCSVNRSHYRAALTPLCQELMDTLFFQPEPSVFADRATIPLVLNKLSTCKITVKTTSDSQRQRRGHLLNMTRIRERRAPANPPDKPGHASLN